jgi:integrase
MKRRQGNITKRADAWQIKFEYKPREGRKRFTRYVTVKGTRQDAQKLTRLLSAADAGTLPDPSNATVADYLRSWLDSAHEQSPKTLERYRELAERQIIAHLGATKLQKLKPEAIRAWHSTLLQGGLSARTAGHAHRLLRLVLGCAVRNGTLARNVAALEAPPKVEDKEIEILSPDQALAVLGALQGSTLHPIVSLALATGTRRGELCGLQWGDIDLDSKPAVLRVERSIEETRSGLRVKSPKTKRGRRNLTLPPEAVAMLRAHKVQQMELRLVLGQGAIRSDTFVFSDVEGRMLSPDNLSRDWRRVCNSKNLPRVPFHALRHTHASMLIAAKVDILTISRRLGHSKAAMTLDVYGHLIGGADEAAAKAIEGMLK